MVKNLPTMQETRVRSLNQEESLEKGLATHSSVLAWKIAWTEEPGGLQSMGSQKLGHDWATNTFTFAYTYMYMYVCIYIYIYYIHTHIYSLFQILFHYNFLGNIVGPCCFSILYIAVYICQVQASNVSLSCPFPWITKVCFLGRWVCFCFVNKFICIIFLDSIYKWYHMIFVFLWLQSVSSVTQLCPPLCNPMDCSTPGLPVHHQLPECAQTHVHWVGDAIQPSHPLLSLLLLSSIFPSIMVFSKESVIWHQMAKVLEFQLQL